MTHPKRIPDRQLTPAPITNSTIDTRLTHPFVVAVFRNPARAEAQ